MEGSKLLVRSDGTLQIIETNGTRSSVLERAGKSSNQQTLLNDIWVLETLHKKELTSQHFSKERPRLEFHNADNKVLGFGGCNQLTGEFITEGNQITITRIASTRMACSGINESLFLEIIQQASSFKIISGKLYLFEGSGELARFKKVD
jgi:heat shock protein HslJ